MSQSLASAGRLTVYCGLPVLAGVGAYEFHFGGASVAGHLYIWAYPEQIIAACNDVVYRCVVVEQLGGEAVVGARCHGFLLRRPAAVVHIRDGEDIAVVAQQGNLISGGLGVCIRGDVPDFIPSLRALVFSFYHEETFAGRSFVVVVRRAVGGHLHAVGGVGYTCG